MEVRVRGILPKDKEKMLAKVEEAIAVWSEEEPIYAWA